MSGAPAPAATAWARERAWLIPVLLTLALYLPACFGADWVIDDRPHIPDHLRPGDLAGEWRVPTHAHAADLPGYVWRPLPSTVYQVWAGLWGRSPAPFRLLNLLVQLLNLGLVYRVGRAVGAGALGAALLTTAWAVHPLVPDVVAWSAAAYDLQATTFLLLGLLLALAERPALLVRALGGGALFLLALLCKESSLSWLAALPLVLLLLRGWRPALSHLLVLAPVAAAHSAWHARIVGPFQTSAGDILARRWWDFLGLWTDSLRWPLTMPVRGGFTHLVVEGGEPLVPAGLLLLVVGGVGLLRGGSAGRHLAAAVGTWALMITPGTLAALTFGQQSSRYLFTGLALAMALLGGALPRLGRAWAGPALTAAWCLAWLPATHARIQAWRDERALFTQELRVEPDNPFAMKCLARLMVGAGEIAPGLELWDAALQAPPPSFYLMDPQRERLDLAQAAARAGRRDLARAQLDAFLAEEQAQGRQVDPSVRALRDALGSAPP